jgi:hypothetical protein
LPRWLPGPARARRLLLVIISYSRLRINPYPIESFISAVASTKARSTGFPGGIHPDKSAGHQQQKITGPVGRWLRDQLDGDLAIDAVPRDPLARLVADRPDWLVYGLPLPSLERARIPVPRLRLSRRSGRSCRATSSPLCGYCGAPDRVKNNYDCINIVNFEDGFRAARR